MKGALLALVLTLTGPGRATESSPFAGSADMQRQLSRLLAAGVQLKPRATKIALNRCWRRDAPPDLEQELRASFPGEQAPLTFCIGTLVVDRSSARPLLDVEVWIDGKRTQILAHWGHGLGTANGYYIIGAPLYTVDSKTSTGGVAEYLLYLIMVFDANGAPDLGNCGLATTYSLGKQPGGLYPITYDIDSAPLPFDEGIKAVR